MTGSLAADLAEVRRAVLRIAAGRPVVLGDETGETSALVFAAERATTEVLAFVVRHGSGLVGVALDAATCARLRLVPQRAGTSGTDHGPLTAVDLVGTGTGISASARARTVAALADPGTAAGDLVRPGHVLPLRAAAGGVHVRLGFAEAAADLARAAGAGVAEAGAVLLGPSGELAGRIEAEEFARRHGLVRVSARAVRDYRRRTEPQVERAAVADLPTAAGRFRALGYRGTSGSATPGAEHVVLVAGALGEPGPVPLHVHAECLTGDVLGSTACGCRRTWADALARIGGTGRGVLVYHRSPHAQACGLRPDPGTNDAAWTAAAVLADLGVDAVLPVGLDPAAAEVLSAFGVGVSSEFCAAVG